MWTVIIAVLLALAAGGAVRKIIRDKKAGRGCSSCGMGCSGCGMSCSNCGKVSRR